MLQSNPVQHLFHLYCRFSPDAGADCTAIEDVGLTADLDEILQYTAISVMSTVVVERVQVQNQNEEV